MEQKNWTHVRQWLGYHRFDIPEIVPFLNKLYKTEWRLFHNFFYPSVKLIAKQRIASKTIKRYDNPKTPYQRIMDSPDISPSKKRSLTKLFEQLNRAPESVQGQRGGSPLQADALRPVTERNCVTAR